MKALVWTAVNRLEVMEIERPRPGPNEVLVRVSHVGICGTDLHVWRGEHSRAWPPMVLGHKFSGVIEEANPSAQGLAEGDGVVVYPIIGCGRPRPCRSGCG